MPAVDPIILELRADVRRYQEQIRVTTRLVESQLDRQERSILELESAANRSTRRIADGFASMGQRISGFVSGLALGGLAREFLSLADTSKQLEAQLKLATNGFGTLAQAQKDVERIAGATRAGLVETTSLYGNLVRATQAQGGSQEQAARATETFSKALKLGGGDAQAAASATLQFGQALASGVLRGDEFNSIAEASPRLLQLLADAMGKPKSELRSLAEEGKLTSDVLFRSLTDRKFTSGIDDEFKTLPITFSEALQAVENAATITIGAFDRGGGFSSALANFVTDGAGGFAELAKSAERFGSDTRAVFDGLGNVFDPIGANGNAVFDALGIKIFGVRDQIQSLLDSIDKFRNIDANIENGVKGALNRAIDRAGGGAHFEETPLSNLGDRFRTGSRVSTARGRLNASVRRLEGNGFIVPRNADGSVNEAGIRRRVAKGPEPTAATESQKNVAKYQSLNADLERLKAGASATELKAINTKIAKNNQIISALNKGVSIEAARAAAGGGKGGSADAAARKAEAARQKALREDEAFESEKAGLNRDILRARRATTVAADTLAAYELQEIEAERVRQNGSYENDVKSKKLTEARAKELTNLNNQLAEERVANVATETRRRQVQERVAIAGADLENARDLLEAEAALATTQDERRDSALRLLDLEFRMEKARLDAVLASETATAAEKEIARRRLAVLPRLKERSTAAIELQNSGPLEAYRRANQEQYGDLQTNVENIEVGILQSVSRELEKATKNALGLSGALGDVVGSIIQIGIQRRLIGPLADALFGKADGSTGSGKIGGFLTSIIGAVGGRASGGYMAPNSVARVNEGRGGVELLRMGSQGGTVIPLGQQAVTASRGGDRHFTIQVDARNSVTPAGFADQLSKSILSRAAQMDLDAGKATLRQTPGYLASAQRFGGPKTI